MASALVSSNVSSLKSAPKKAFRRGAYGELISPLPKSVKPLVHKLVHDVIGFEEGFVTWGSKRVGRYEAHNYDIYGYDFARKLVVIQFRKTNKSKYGVNVSKRYVLAGFDEGQAFFHVLPSSPQQKKNLAEISPQALVRWCEAKIFGVKEDKLAGIVRQGDVAFVPAARLPKEAKKYEGTVTYRNSHKVSGDLYEIPENDRFYAQYFVSGAGVMEHIPGQHKTQTVTGIYEIVTGDRGEMRSWLNGPVD
ncbi:MAG: hypothetical protein ACYDBP_07230 [Leptospirales bacterium]